MESMPGGSGDETQASYMQCMCSTTELSEKQGNVLLVGTYLDKIGLTCFCWLVQKGRDVKDFWWI